MRRPRIAVLWAPAVTALMLTACTTGPVYTYGPASYAPPGMAPTYQPIPVPLPPPPISATPLTPPGSPLLDDPADRAPPLPDTAAAPLEPAPQIDPTPVDTAPSDPVTDLLLTPQSQQDQPQRDQPPAVVKKPTPPEANPLMGFRPMRGQTAPSL